MHNVVEMPFQVTVVGKVLSIEDRRHPWIWFLDTTILKVSVTEEERVRLNETRAKAGLEGEIEGGVGHIYVRLKTGDKAELGPSGWIRIVFEFKPERVVRTVRGYCLEFPQARIRSIRPASV